MSSVKLEIHNDATDETTATIRIASDKYTGVIFKLGEVGFDNEDGKIKFKYDIIDDVGIPIVDSEIIEIIGDSIVKSLEMSIENA